MPTASHIEKDNPSAADILSSKYQDAGRWVGYGAELLRTADNGISSLVDVDPTIGMLQDLTAAIDAIGSYVPPTSFVYTPLGAPTLTDIPGYVAPTLGTLLSIPAVVDQTIGAAPPTAISFSNGAFSDSLADSLKSKLLSDLATASTGLGNAEAGLFARETARQSATRATAYNEITTQFSSRGFDMPPGALLAKQTEANNESNIRLADSSSAIMAESAKLAQAWNQTTVSASNQLIDLLGRLFDSRIMRDFEAAKSVVGFAIEGYKQEIAAAISKMELNAKAISSTVAANEGITKVFMAEVEGQTAPMKAIAEANRAIADAYDAQVKGKTADLAAQMMPEELKLKGYEINAKIAGIKGDLAGKEVTLALDAALRHLQISATAMQESARAATQIIASALNSVNASVSMGESFGQSISEDINTTSNDVRKSETVNI